MNLRTLSRAFLVAIVLASSVIAAACSSASTAGDSGTPGTNASVGGDITGAAFVPASAVANFSQSDGLLWIGISSTTANACDPACTAANALEISVPSALATPGTYAIGEQSTAAHAYVNSVCPAGGRVDAFLSASGSVTLDAVSSSAASGSFDITFSDTTSSGGQKVAGGHLTGTFRAASCPAK